MLIVRLDTIDLRRFQVLAVRWPERFLKVIKRVVTALSSKLLSGIKRLVAVDTGNLRRTWVLDVVRELDGTAGYAGGVTSNAPYAAAVEWGDDRLHRVRAHQRRTRTGRMAAVRAHERRANQRARPYIRPSIREATVAAPAIIRAALAKAEVAFAKGKS